MKRILALITVIILLVLSLSACSKKTERATVYYYYYSACSSCEDGKKFLQQAREAIGFEADLTDYQFILVNTFKESNPESLQNLAAQHGLEMEKLSYPLLFSSNGYLSGEEKIESELEIFLLSALTSNETKKEPL